MKNKSTDANTRCTWKPQSMSARGGNEQCCLQYKQAMLIQLFSKPQCWLLNWSFCQKLLKIPRPKPGGKHCPYCKPLAWQLWPWFTNLLFVWVIRTPVSSFTDFSATACVRHCRRIFSYCALEAPTAWLLRFTG